MGAAPRAGERSGSAMSQGAFPTAMTFSDFLNHARGEVKKS